MDDLAGQLAHALQAADARAARHLLAQLAPAEPATRDTVLDELARHAAAGSPLALELLAELVDELGLARRAVHRMLVDEAAVADVAQDTLIAMTTSISSFRGDAKLTTWLHQIARNRVVDHLRRSRATTPLDAADVGHTQRISSMVSARETVRQLVDRLPEPYRETVVRRDIEQEPYAEIAEAMGRNLNTVKSHVARGRAMLAGMIGEEDTTP